MNPDAERVARNQATFREANEQIVTAADGIVDAAPFLCECADRTCVEIVRLELSRYRSIRESPRQFVVAPGHEESAGGWARVTERTETFVVAEKIGDAGELAEQLAEEGA